MALDQVQADHYPGRLETTGDQALRIVRRNARAGRLVRDRQNALGSIVPACRRSVVVVAVDGVGRDELHTYRSYKTGRALGSCC